MAKRSRATGLRYEREALKWWQDQQIRARRTVPGGASQKDLGDIDVDVAGGLKVEVKYSTVDRGMRIVREYLRPVDVLMSRAPGEGWIFSVHAPLMEHLLACARMCEAQGRLPRAIERQAPRELPTLPDNPTPEDVLDYSPDHLEGPHEGGWLER